MRDKFTFATILLSKVTLYEMKYLIVQTNFISLNGIVKTTQMVHFT